MNELYNSMFDDTPEVLPIDIGEGGALPFLDPDAYGRTNRLRNLAMKLTDWDGKLFSLTAALDDQDEPYLVIGTATGPGIGLYDGPDPAPNRPICLTLADLRRLADLGAILVNGLVRTTAAAVAARDGA